MEKMSFEKAEEQILLLIDGELNAQQKAEILAQIECFPVYKSLYDTYAGVKFEDDVSKQDFSYLLKDDTTVKPAIVPMQSNKKYWFKPLTIAASVVFLIGSAWFLMDKNEKNQTVDNHIIVKDDNNPAIKRNPLLQIANDSLIKAKKSINTLPKPKDKVQNKFKDNQSALLVNNANNSQRTKIAAIDSKEFTEKLSLAGIPIVNKNNIEAQYVAAHPKKIENEFSSEFLASEGLLVDVVKAGQWLFSNERKKTTVEFSSNSESKKSIKIKF